MPGRRGRNPNNRVLRRASFSWKPLDNEAILVRHGKIKIILNPTASMVWRLLDGYNSVGDVIDVIAERYAEEGVSRKTVSEDVTELITELKSFGLLTHEMTPWRKGRPK
jgi:hypothetical protein